MPSKKSVKRTSIQIAVRRTGVAFTALESTEQEAQLVNAIVSALSKYNLNRIRILDRAFAEGGSALVARIEDARNALEDAYYELVGRQLDRNHQQYVDLTAQAKAETRELEKDINTLASIGAIIGRFAQAIDAIGRILIVLGV